MRSAAIVGLLLLAGEISLSAQTGERVELQTKTELFVFQGATPCPVGMHVRQGIGEDLMAVKNGKSTKVFAARLRLNLFAPQSAHADSKQITGATVTVHGLNGYARMVPLDGKKNRPSELTTTLDVSFTPDEDKSSGADLLLPGFTTATMVDLESVTYADGSTWKVTPNEGWCHARPDPIMLITGR